MPKVPVYDNLKVAPTSLPNTSVSAPVTPEASTIANRQMGQLGNAISSASQDLMKIQLDASDVRATDAANKFRQELSRQMFGDPSNPSSGIINQKGVSAFQRLGPDGPRDLYSEAQENMDQVYSKIASDLSDDTQRGMFAAKVREYKDQHLSNVLRHQSQEWNGYQVSVAEDTIKTSQKNMGINYKNPDVLSKEMANIYESVKKIANIKGTQGSVESDSRNFISKSLSEAAKQSIFNKDLSSARSLIKNYKDKWEMDDLVSTESLLRTETNKALVDSVSDQIKRYSAPKIFTSNADRMVNLLIENGVSLKAENGAPEENQRVAIKKEFEKRFKTFNGNIEATVASFGGDGKGVDAVKYALDQSSKQERGPAAEKRPVKDFLPGNLNEFYSQLMESFNRGLGVERAPTTVEVKAIARKLLGPGASLELVKAAEARAEQDLNDMLQSKKQEEDNWASAAVQALARPEINGDYSKLPPNVLSELNSRPDAKKKVLEIVDSMKKVTGRPELFVELSNDKNLSSLSPQELEMKLVMLPEADATRFRARWNDLKEGKKSISADSLDNDEIDRQWNIYYRMEGKDPNAVKYKEGVQTATDKKEYLEYMMRAQQVEGKKFSPKEIADFTKIYFQGRVQTKVIKNQYKDGRFEKVEVQSQLPTKIKDIKYTDLSKSEVEAIKAGFARLGNYEPTEDEIVRQARQMLYTSKMEEMSKLFRGQ